MRLKRQKGFRKTLRFYRVNFDLKEPFHVLVDGTFIFRALSGRVHIKEQLPKMLDGKVTPMVTNCTLAELRALGDKASGAAIIAKGYYRVKCHHETAIGARECIASVVGLRNERRFLVATNDDSLRATLRQVPGCPLIYLRGDVCPTLEQPSDASQREARTEETKRLAPQTWEKPKLFQLQRSEETAKAAQEAREAKRAKRGKKGANPLSCKKKKKKDVRRPEQQVSGFLGSTNAPAHAGGEKRQPAAENCEGAELEPAAKRRRTRSRRQNTVAPFEPQ